MKALRFVAIMFCSVFAAGADAAERLPFIISYWCGPPSGGDYDAQYAEVADCNFSHAMFPVNNASPEQNKVILDTCQKHGLKYIPYDGRVTSHNPGDPSFESTLDSMIKDYKDHPALAGYFLADEPGPGLFPRLAAVNQYLLKKDPKRLPYINLYPNYVDENALGVKYDQYVEQFCKTVKPRLLSYDHYALVAGAERENYFANMELIRRNALKFGAAMGFIFQCTPHFAYRDPTDADLRWQVNTALAYGCKALLYFTYFTPTDPAANFHNGILDAKGKRTHHYAMAKSINAELKNLSGTLEKLTSTAVYHTAPIPSGCTDFASDAPIQGVEGGPLVLGLLKHDDGSRWAIVVNRDLRKAASAKLRFDPKLIGLETLSPQTGQLSPVPLTDRTLRLELPPSGMKIVKFAM